MEFVLIFLVPVIFILAITIPLSPRHKGRRAKVFFIIIGVPFVALLGDELIGQAIFKSICINDGYKQIEPITSAGYYDSDTTKSGCNKQCFKALVVKGIPYYENTAKYNNSKYPDEHFKYYLTDLPILDSRQCASNIEIGDELKTLIKGKCVIYEKTNKLSSKYEISIRQSSYTMMRPFEIKKLFSYIKTRENNKIIASASTYMFWGGWLRNASFGHNSATTCSSYKNQHGILMGKLFSNKNN